MYPRSSRDLPADALFAAETADDRVMDDELIRVCAAATRIACRRMTPRYLKALDDSVEQACCLPSRFDWDRKVAAHAEIVNLLADAAADPALAVLVRDVPGQLYDLMFAVGPAASGIIAGSRRRLLALLQAGDADGAAREMEQHLGGLLWMRRVFRHPARNTVQTDIAV
jgi:DNA-binding GntR family transcriptional regulator